MSTKEWDVCRCWPGCFQRKILNWLYNTVSCGELSSEGLSCLENVIYFQSFISLFLFIRFNDISVAIRTKCVQYSMHFLLNHPELRQDVTETLKLRQHDAEESVR